MNRLAVKVGSIFLVPSTAMLEDLHKKRKKYSHLPEVAQIEEDMNILNDEEGVPATITRDRQEKQILQLYTPAYYLKLTETGQRDSYTIEHLEPLRLDEHDRLSRGALQVRASEWKIYDRIGAIPLGQRSYWHTIENAWHQLEQKSLLTTSEQEPATQPLSSSREEYINTSDAILETVKQLESAQENTAPQTLHLHRQKALTTLRTAKMEDRSLLQALIDSRYQDYQPAPIRPRNPLNPEQEELFRRALSVPDLLLVEDIPGSDKTRVLNEIAYQCHINRQHVLLTAPTLKNVDDILEHLAREHTLVLLDDREHVNPARESLVLDKQVQEVRQTVLRRTTYFAQRMGRLVIYKDTIDQWIEHLTHCIEVIGSSEQTIADMQKRRNTIEQFVSEPFRPGLSEFAMRVKQYGEAITRNQTRLTRWTACYHFVKKWSHIPLLGLLCSGLMFLFSLRMKKFEKALHNSQVIYTTTLKLYQEAEEIRQRALHDDPEYTWCEQSINQVIEDRKLAEEQSWKAVEILQKTLNGLVAVEPPIKPFDIRLFQHYLNWYSAVRMLLEKRYRLLNSWRSALVEQEHLLHRLLLKTADVVCGTCAGIAKTATIAEGEFDLALVHEAERFSLPDLLVPLIPAKRALLIGDQRQPSTFLPALVQNWIDSLSPEEAQVFHVKDEGNKKRVLTALTKSIFEQLVSGQTPPTHIVRLTEQRRIPRIIADFISHQFYEGQLQTVDEQPQETQFLFNSPLAIIDTSDLPLKERKESLPGKRKERARNGEINPEAWGQPGYLNVIEAKLLVNLATRYHSINRDWRILAPYQAQVTLIQRLLAAHFPNDKLGPRVTTVSACLENASDVVLYSFTRSNAAGNIGLLKERRLLNAVMTRASKQLILIGDMSTWKQADEEEIRQLANALYEYVSEQGDLLTYDECLTRLQHLSKESIQEEQKEAAEIEDEDESTQPVLKAVPKDATERQAASEKKDRIVEQPTSSLEDTLSISDETTIAAQPTSSLEDSSSTSDEADEKNGEVLIEEEANEAEQEKQVLNLENGEEVLDQQEEEKIEVSVPQNEEENVTSIPENEEQKPAESNTEEITPSVQEQSSSLQKVSEDVIGAPPTNEKDEEETRSIDRASIADQ
jgi:hypothetical protein